MKALELPIAIVLGCIMLACMILNAKADKILKRLDAMEQKLSQPKP